MPLTTWSYAHLISIEVDDPGGATSLIWPSQIAYRYYCGYCWLHRQKHAYGRWHSHERTANKEADVHEGWHAYQEKLDQVSRCNA